MIRRILAILTAAAALLSAPMVARADGDVSSAVTSALIGGSTTATSFLVAAIAIPIAFLVFKLGKRVSSVACSPSHGACAFGFLVCGHFGRKCEVIFRLEEPPNNLLLTKNGYR
jgi:hypothetical protein